MPKTQDCPVLKEEEYSPLVALDSDIFGSRVYLYKMILGKSDEYAPVIITPSDFRIHRQRFSEIYNNISKLEQIAVSQILKNKTIDNANSDFLTLLLPPYPLQTLDIQNKSPRVIIHLFPAINAELLEYITKDFN